MFSSTVRQMSFAVSEPEPTDTASHTDRWLEVLVDCPGAQGLYTYRSPPTLTVKPGDILTVPFGSQQVGAIAVRFVDCPPPDLEASQIRHVEEVISPGFFPDSYWTLLERVAHYYYASLMQVIRVALPPGLLGRSQRRIRLINPPPGDLATLSPVAQRLLAQLHDSKTGDYTWHYLQQQVGAKHNQSSLELKRGLQTLLHQGWVESYVESPTHVRPKLQQSVTLTANSGVDREDLTPRQREVLEVLRRRGGDLWLRELLQICHTSSGTLKLLEKKGCLVIQGREVLRTEAGQLLQRDRPKVLTAEQAQAVTTMQSLTAYALVLLHGVTGSGKTEVYLQTIAPLLEQGKSVLVLVPEIGLTPQLTDRFRARFGDRVCVYHSALSEGERYDTWRQMTSGAPQVVIGTRSAIFAPLPHLALIILDEEHDGSFKQEQPAPCYHARTVAQWRAELDNCPLLLGSATPSLETWIKVGAGDPLRAKNSDHYLALPTRIQSRPMPPIEIVDMRQELGQGNRSVFSRTLQEALEQLQARREQGILFIHRRGHSTFVSCRSCGYVLDCPNCDVSLSYHQIHEGATQVLRCHYCNYTQLHPPDCPQCGSPYLKFFGSGTQRVAQELDRQFPQLRLLRFDSDTTRTKGAHRTLLNQFAQGEADLLVGTQMLTKGIDLPQVTLVGVVAADGLLHMADYGASERAFQTLTQVAGRAGRGDEPGRVILQTYTPNHAVIQAVQQHEYQSFVETELQHRAELNYPPYSRFISLRLSSPDAVAVQASARRIAQVLHPSPEAGYEVLGPAPAPIFRVARRYRWQILLKLLRRGGADRVTPTLPDLPELRTYCPAIVSLTIDVDPLS